MTSMRFFTVLRPAVLSAFLFQTLALAAAQAATPLLLDDYSDPKSNRRGIERLLVDDKSLGSQSQATQRFDGGVLSV